MLAVSSVSQAAPWLALTGALAVLLVLDLALVRGRGGTMSLRAAAAASAFWVAIALAFFGVLLVAGDGGDATAFLAGYLVEKSLSLDNVFVFLLVFSAFALPVAERHRLLTYGIVLALVLRAVFIVAGAAALSAVSWLSFVFAAFLIWTGWKMFRHRHDHDSEQALVARLRRRLPIAPGPSEGRLVRREGARLVLTTGGAALVGIAAVDIVFAVDSVPAILAITNDTFIVFAANAFALLGLRPLFFLVAELVERLYYLKTALAALLVFIGAKMAAGEVVGKLGPEISLPVIGLILGTGVVASLLRSSPEEPCGGSAMREPEAPATLVPMTPEPEAPMRALVVYESMFGNTEAVAQAIADGLSTRVEVEAVEVGAAPAAVPDGVDLLLVGGPTHAFGLSRPSTRADAAKQAPAGLVSDRAGLREWLEGLGEPDGVSAAAFSTRVRKRGVPGSAAKAAARRLRHAGYRIAASPEDFWVEDVRGPLAAGELERARQWGETVGVALAVHGPAVTA